MDVKQIRIEEYSYELPDSKIAYTPLQERDASKLLVYQNGTIEDSHYYSIANFLPSDSLMIFNDTKVIPARLYFTKDTGAVIEIFILEPYQLSITQAMEQTHTIAIKCFIGGASKWKQDIVLQKECMVNGNPIIVNAKKLQQLEDAYIVQLSWQTEDTFATILEAIGKMPLPPYIKRKVEVEDTNRYQTIYAKEKGSVAAPTAGLHFTEQVLQSIQQKNIEIANVTLHVGAGTFKPVTAATMEQHQMHQEYFIVSINFVKKLLAYDSKVIAVGTTSMRTIESLYWLGVKVQANSNLSMQELQIQQWDAYALESIDRNLALTALITWMEREELTNLYIPTQLIIAPSYTYKIGNILVTNFHQPQSTLLLLVAAATNGNWKKIYEHALQNEYRFLSYGDGCLIFIN